MLIGEGFAGDVPNGAHINLMLGAKNGPMGTAYAVAAASPGPGHVPFQVVLKLGVPAEPATLFIAKANLRNPNHETMTWGPAQMGVAAGITMAVLDGVLPAEARQDWVAIACVWVHWDANDADAVFVTGGIHAGEPFPADFASANGLGDWKPVAIVDGLQVSP